MALQMLVQSVLPAILGSQQQPQGRGRDDGQRAAGESTAGGIVGSAVERLGEWGERAQKVAIAAFKILVVLQVLFLFAAFCYAFVYWAIVPDSLHTRTLIFDYGMRGAPEYNLGHQPTMMPGSTRSSARGAFDGNTCAADLGDGSCHAGDRKQNHPGLDHLPVYDPFPKLAAHPLRSPVAVLDLLTDITWTPGGVMEQAFREAKEAAEPRSVKRKREERRKKHTQRQAERQKEREAKAKSEGGIGAIATSSQSDIMGTAARRVGEDEAHAAAGAATAAAALRDPSDRLLAAGVKYNVGLELELPLSESNAKMGPFMVYVTLLAQDGVVLGHSARHAMLSYTSPGLRYMRMACLAPLYLLGLKTEAEKIFITSFDHLLELEDYPLTRIEIVLSNHNIELKRSLLTIKPQLHGIRYLMSEWFYSSLVMGTAFIACGLSGAFVLIYFFYWTTQQQEEEGTDGKDGRGGGGKMGSRQMQPRRQSRQDDGAQSGAQFGSTGEPRTLLNASSGGLHQRGSSAVYRSVTTTTSSSSTLQRARSDNVVEPLSGGEGMGPVGTAAEGGVRREEAKASDSSTRTETVDGREDEGQEGRADDAASIGVESATSSDDNNVVLDASVESRGDEAEGEGGDEGAAHMIDDSADEDPQGNESDEKEGEDGDEDRSSAGGGAAAVSAWREGCGGPSSASSSCQQKAKDDDGSCGGAPAAVESKGEGGGGPDFWESTGSLLGGVVSMVAGAGGGTGTGAGRGAGGERQVSLTASSPGFLANLPPPPPELLTSGQSYSTYDEGDCDGRRGSGRIERSDPR